VRAQRLRTAVQTVICGTLLGIVAGCVGTTDRIEPTGHGTLMIPSQDLMGLSSSSTERAKALQEAAAYCRKLGRDIQTVLSSEPEGGIDGLAAPEIEFRCVPSESGERHAPARQ
jgi:hypothetical protein